MKRIFNLVPVNDGPAIYECLRCGHREELNDNIVDCPKCENNAVMHNIRNPRE